MAGRSTRSLGIKSEISAVDENSDNIAPGDIYEDVFYHPCLCIERAPEGDHVWGISLIDGSQPRTCDLLLSGIRKLSVAEAWEWKTQGPPQLRDDPTYPPEQRWWEGGT